jgi:hypothetical protein
MFLSIGESKPRCKKVFSEATMWVEDSDHSHIFISWKDSLGLRWVAEARGSGIRMISNKQFKDENIIINVYNYHMNTTGLNRLREYLWKSLGMCYGFLQIYGLLEMRILNKIYRLLKIDKKAVNRFVDGEASQICVEFALRCYEAVTGAKMLHTKFIEQMGLIEMRKFNEDKGIKLSKEVVDRING